MAMRAVQAQRALAAGWLALATTGCAAWRVESVPPKELLKDPGVHAVRVTRADKSKVELYYPAIKGDSIVGHPTETAIARVVMPLSQVQTIATKHTSMGKTLLAVLAVGGGVALYGLLQSLNQGY
jgi:hypothetical protein